MIKFFLGRGHHVIYDATNLRRRDRGSILRLAKGYPVTVVWVDSSLDLTLERNQGRERNVPEDVIKRMNQSLEPPDEVEGFSLVRVRPGREVKKASFPEIIG